MKAAKALPPPTWEHAARHRDNKVAADHYHHWKEDVDLMAELGLKVYRMGFAWSRIMPDATCHPPTPRGWAFYDRLIDYLLEKGIEPLVTLYHFECPQALVDAFGGWLDRKMIDAYLKYAEVCFTHFKGRVKRWVTVNEQLIATAAGIMNGNFEQDKQKNLQNIYQMSYHVSLAEHQAISLLRQIDPEAQIGRCVLSRWSIPSPVAARMFWLRERRRLMEFYLLDLSVRGEYPPYVASYLKSHGLYPQTLPEDAAVLKASTPDFIGINYYFSIAPKPRRVPSTTTSRPSGCRTPSTSVIIPTCAKPSGWTRASTRWACILGCARSIIATVCHDRHRKRHGL